MAAEPLRFNPSNPVTSGIWRVERDGATAVLKTVRGDQAPRHPDWEASNDPRSWLYWRREVELYTSDLPERFVGSGLRTPDLLEVVEHAPLATSLVLEDVPGRTGAALTHADLARAARALGRVQAELHARPADAEWLSVGALRDHCASKHVDSGLLDDPAAWDHPLVRATWPAGLREGLVRLHDRREDLFALAAAAPRTLGHLDFWANNLFVGDPDAPVVAIDWAFAGDAALGEDLANLLAESVLDDFEDPDQLPVLDGLLFAAYLQGLRDGGYAGPTEAVRLGMCAAAVKWHWLGALHLERARSGEHHGYGGGDHPDPRAQYRARGRALAWLVERADEALAVGGA